MRLIRLVFLRDTGGKNLQIGYNLEVFLILEDIF
jgi:hypothetical protein